MTEATLKTLIETTAGIPVFDASDSIVFPGATIEVYSETQRIYGDGKGSGTVNSVQVDLWYTDRSARDTAVTALITALNNQDCTTPTIERRYDTTAHKFRATFHFEFK